MASANEAVIAAAGSGKTEYLLESALSEPNRRTLIVTYTNENLREINSRLWEKVSGPPPGVTTMTWFEFLLRDGVKPYQSYKTRFGRIRSINFITQNPPFARRDDFDNYYLDSSDNIYRDAVSDLAFELNLASGGKVVKRLEGMYDQILVDEVQDMAGYDLDLLQLLLVSSIEITMVGDPRQSVYLTNRSNKNSQYRGAKLVDWITERVEGDDCFLRHMDVSYRCTQAICDVADSIYPDMQSTSSLNDVSDHHLGVFLVHTDHLAEYIENFSPQELRWDRRSPLAGPLARNFGQVKGQAFDRVLIHPTGTITKYLENGDALADGTAAKFYVAVTRARFSVAVVTKKHTTASQLPFWRPVSS
ncbi:MAG: UvrD-helicase domain-containing protein [Solirubrobacterales bacterium]|nr:UvrD-helicase domain-containing protein [Solirubrobacterales bacterium]